MKISYLLKTIGWLIFFAITVCAQSQRINSGEDEQILLNVTVNTEKGDWITGLRAENFKVYEGKTLQPVTFFSAEEVPMSIGILVGKSQYRGVPITAIQQALTKFVNKSNPQNEYFLMSFDARQELLLDNTQDSKAAVLQAIEKLSAIESQRNTKRYARFYDAVQMGFEKISNGKYAKKVLLILSEFMDTESKNRFEDIKKLIKQTDVLFYNLNIMDYREYNYVINHYISGRQFQVFSKLTDLSGGTSYSPGAYFLPGELEKLDELLYRIAEELRSQYTIGFKATKITDKDKKEKWRDVKIEVEIPPNAVKIGKPFVRTRTGYFSNTKSN